MAEALCWAVAGGAFAAALYAIHRRYRWLAERGFVDDAKASGGGPFFALRDVIEPSAKQIRHVHEDQRHHAEREAPGEDEPPSPPADGAG